MWSGIKISPRLAGLSERHVLVPRRREMANETAHTSTDSRGYEINGPFRAQRLHTRARARMHDSGFGMNSRYRQNVTRSQCYNKRPSCPVPFSSQCLQS